MQALLKSRISQERNEIKRLMEMLTERGTEKKKPKERIHSPNEAEMTAMIQLVKENQLLEVCSFKRWSGRDIFFATFLYIYKCINTLPRFSEKDDDVDTQYNRGERRLRRTTRSISGASTNGQNLTTDLLVTLRDYNTELYAIKIQSDITFLHIMTIYSL